MNPRLTLSFILFLLHPLTSHCQWVQTTTDTLADVFPFSIGNQWTYRYYTLMEIWPGGNPGETRTDSGRVTYSVSGRTTNADSTHWQFQVQRDLMRHQIFWFIGGGYRDTLYPIRDSSYFDMIESHQGQHQVYRNGDPYMIRLDVFPFTRNFVDTTLIYRFRQVGAGDTIAFRSWIGPPPGSLFRSTFTFKKNVGLIRNSYHSGTMDVYSTNEHFLLSSVIASVFEDPSSSAPSSYMLSQNYPNPFNPRTTIEISIPQARYVTLTVHDVLGQEVVTLVCAELHPGTHKVVWEATGVASGVYFYQLKAESFVETKKMLLMK